MVLFLWSPPSLHKIIRLPPLSTYLTRLVIYSGLKLSLGAAIMNKFAFLIFSNSMGSLFKPIWNSVDIYLVLLFIFLCEILQVGARVTDFLLWSIEDNLYRLVMLRFFEHSFFKYKLNASFIFANQILSITYISRCFKKLNKNPSMMNKW